MSFLVEPKYLDATELYVEIHDRYERYWKGQPTWYKRKYREEKVLERIAQEIRIPVRVVEENLTL